MAPKRGRGTEPRNPPVAEKRVTRGSSKKNPAPELPAPPPRKRAKPVPNGEGRQRRKKKAERKEEEAVAGAEASVDHSPAEGCEEELRNKKKAEKKEEELVDGVGASANAIVIEHCKQCNSFKKTAEMLVDGLKKMVPHVIVKMNPSKPRRGCFEIRDEDGHIFVSLLINARKTITILVVDNGAMSALSNLPLDSVKKALSLHVILDYYDIEKLQELSQRSTILTTLYQTTGVAEYSEGFVNVTLTSNGRVEFGSAIKEAGLTSELVKTIAAQPYDISVLQVSSVIIPPALKYMAPPVQMNITTLLLNAGFKVFVGLLQSTGALSTYQSTASSGVTIFAPKDQALASLPVNLTSDQKASLMLYHGVTGYLPVESLSKVTAPLGTLASNGNSKFQLVVKTNGQSVALSTGLNIVNVVKTVIDQQQVIVYAIDGLLRAPEIFSPGSVPVPTPKIAPLLTSPPPNAEAPAPSDDALAPSNDASPPSPPSAVAPAADGPAADTPAVSPSAGTAEAPADAKTKDASSATRLGFGSCFAAVLCTLCYMNM